MQCPAHLTIYAMPVNRREAMPWPGEWPLNLRLVPSSQRDKKLPNMLDAGLQFCCDCLPLLQLGGDLLNSFLSLLLALGIGRLAALLLQHPDFVGVDLSGQSFSINAAI